MRVRPSLFVALLIAGSMFGASLLAQHFTPRTMLASVRPNVNLERMVPTRFGQWHVDESQAVAVADLSANELSDRIYADVLSRTYVNKAGDRIMLAIAYGKDQSESLQVHTPEYCYPAQGYSIGEPTLAMFDLAGRQHSIVRLVAKGNGGARIEPVSYWVVMGDHVVTHGQKQRRNVRFFYGFKGYVPDGVFFRVSSLGGDVSRQYDIQQAFIKDMFSSVPEDVRDRLAGKYEFSTDWLFI
jgi:EpsI family protein